MRSNITPIRQSLSGEQHLTVDDLASRWHCSQDTVRRRYRQWGLKPMRFGKSLIFPAAQVAEAEARRTGLVAAE